MINYQLLIKVNEILNINDIKNLSIMNKNLYNFYKNNINYIGLLKLKTLGFKTFNKEYNNFNIYSEIINLRYSSGDLIIKLNEKINFEDALRFSAAQGRLEVVKYLISCGANIHANNDQAFRFSAENGHLEVVKVLIESGADIHTYDDYALRWSAIYGYLEIVKVLIESGANIHACNDQVFQWSTDNGHLEVVKYLVSCKSS